MENKKIINWDIKGENKEIMLKCPLNEKFMSKRTNDSLYVYLLTKSVYADVEKNNRVRFIRKSDISSRDVIASVSGISNERKFYREMKKLYDDELIEQYFVQPKEGEFMKIVEICDIEGLFCVIPKITLEFMYTCFSRDSIKVYIYLLSKEEYCKKNFNRHYNFSVNEIIKECLLSKSATNSNERKKVRDILKNLLNNGLIKCRDLYYKSGENTFHKFEVVKTSLYVK